MPKGTIVIPIFNTPEDLLRNCIESVLNQTEKDIEIILVNDGSTNNAREVCESYSHIKNISIINQENQGVSVARNAGINSATGEWVMFVDPDDELLPDALEILISNTKQTDDIVATCYINRSETEEKLISFFNTEMFFNNEESKKQLYYHFLWKVTNLAAPWGKIFRRSFLQANNLSFNPKLRRSQDIVFNLYAVNKCNSFHYVNIPVYKYNSTHIATFHDSYKEKLADFYSFFADARYQWMCETDSFKDSVLSEYYRNGAYAIFIIILKVGAFHKLNKISYYKRKKIADDLRNRNCFDFMNEKIKHSKTITISFKERILQFIIKHRLWFILFFLYIIMGK